MSTFDGVIKEYPLITIDNFLEECENFSSTVYFLSHCHRDHMKGLNSRRYFELLLARSFSKIYLSEVSEHLLKNDPEYTHLSEYMVSLPLETPTIIIIPDVHGQIHSRVTVTLLTAGHCPGSVMFLIEGSNGRVLYTGDFRLPVGGSARLTNIHDENGRLKPLDSLYVDTTFCNRKCLYIPTREECLNAIFSLVGPWLSNGSDHIVCFFCPAQYAYEFVFVELFKKFGVKTHVTQEREQKYLGIKIIEDAVTSNPREARIHACAYENSGLYHQNIYKYETPCGYRTYDNLPLKVMKIKPSAMFFQWNKFSDIATYDEKNQMHRVYYSTHSSLTEVRDMVKYLKPKVIYPNVVVGQSEIAIIDLISSLTFSYKDTDSEEELSSISPLGLLESPNKKSSPDNDDNLPFYDEHYKIQNGDQILHADANSQTVSSEMGRSKI